MPRADGLTEGWPFFVSRLYDAEGIYTFMTAPNPEGLREAVAKRLKVMDATAFTLCEENKLPVLVFDLHKHGNIRRAVRGELPRRLQPLAHPGADRRRA